MRRLAGTRILLTGATSGIGLAAVDRFAREGADLALLARSTGALEQAAAVAHEHGVIAHPVPADLTDRAATEAAVAAAAAALGGLDVVVLNAAAVAFGHFLEVEADTFDRAVDVTFTGAANALRAALPHLRESRGTVVATSSIMSAMPLPAFSSYAAAKHALRGLLTTVAIEEREQRTGVRVAMVSPGPVDTPIYGRAASATGRAPAQLPDAYHPDVLADALVAAALKPRHEHVVGLESKLAAGLYAHVRPAGELLLVIVDRWFRTGTEAPEGAGALWEPIPQARLSGGMPARALGDVKGFARNGLNAARQAVRMAPVLLKPVPEQIRAPRRALSPDRRHD